MSTTRWLTVFVSVFSLMACANNTPKKLLSDTTPNDFAQLVTVSRSDDQLATSILYSMKGNVIGRSAFLAATRDKKTGIVDYVLVANFQYSDRNWRFYDYATYETSDGPVDVSTLNIGRDVNCYKSICSYVENIAIPLSEKMIRYIAGRYKQGESNMWRFRIRSKSGEAYNSELAPAEAVGLLQKIELDNKSKPSSR